MSQAADPLYALSQLQEQPHANPKCVPSALNLQSMCSLRFSQLQPQKRQRKAVSPVRRHSSSDTDDPSLAVQREKIKETNRKAQRRYRDRQRVRHHHAP